MSEANKQFVERVSLDFLANTFKTRVERDKLWLMFNNTLGFPSDIWSLIVDYYAEDSRIIDLINQDQEERFTTDGELLDDGSMPNRFIIKHQNILSTNTIAIHVWANRLAYPHTHDGYRHRYSGIHDCNKWQAYDFNLFEILLLLPFSRSHDVFRYHGHNHEETHLPLIRDYLYWRLAHPEIPPSPIIYDDR